MWSRALLKERGKRAFKANYWKCVLVALVLTLIVGSGGTGTVNMRNPINNPGNSIEERMDDFDSFDDSYTDNWDIDEFDDEEDLMNPDFGGGSNSLARDLMNDPFIKMFMTFLMIAMIIGLVIGIFLLAPIEVGCRKFFLDNSEGRGDDVGTMAYAFKSNYKNIVKVQFFRSLFILLWSMLFIIPGIIKAFEYRLVPYLLAENPDMDRKEALELSKKLMYGSKLDAFVLDLSFFGWIFLSVLTFGILAIFYVNPYVYATEAELYRVLSGKVSGTEEEDNSNKEELAKLYGGARDEGEDVYITFDAPDDTSTHD